MNGWIRQAHRWLSITFIGAVLLNFAVMGQGDIALYVGFATLVPLFLLMASGTYMFVRPYFGRAARRSGS